MHSGPGAPLMLGTPQRNPSSLDSHYSYLTQSQGQYPRPALFHRRNERIDWRRLAAIDVDRIARDMDFQVLQDNLEQITFCNIESEVDSRVMDPNFIKLYKMAQFTIEYLLACQEQISAQLLDYEQLKSRVHQGDDETRSEIAKLKEELQKTKQESKKRRKMLETQQRMLVAQNHNYHTCPVCTHAFLSYNYLQDHMKRRHPNYLPQHPRENDADTAKEIQRLKEELERREKHLQKIEVEKAVNEEKLRGLEKENRQLTDDKQKLDKQLTILDSRLAEVQSNASYRPVTTQYDDREVSELTRENKRLRSDLEEQKDLRAQADKTRKQVERENEKLKEQNKDLQTRLDLLQRSSGDMARQDEALAALQEKYHQERDRRKALEEELRQARKPSPNRASPVIPETKPIPAPSVQPKQPVDQSTVQPRPARPLQTGEILLPQHCPALMRKLNENPKFLAPFREKAKTEFVEELEDKDLGVLEGETRLTEADYRTKSERVLHIRRQIQEDLPNFEQIRAKISDDLEKLVQERYGLRRSDTSLRSGASKLVTFKDEAERQNGASYADHASRHSSIQRPSSVKVKGDENRATTHVKTPTHESTDESEDDSRPMRPVPPADPRPSPRKNLPSPSSGVNALIGGSMRPEKNYDNTGSTVTRVPMPVRPATKVTESFLDSDEESQASPTRTPVLPSPSGSVQEKTRIIQQKIEESRTRGQKPAVTAIAQGFLPSKQTVAPPAKNTHETVRDQGKNDDDDDDESLTTLHTANANEAPPAVQRLIKNNPLSSGEMSQYTYDSLNKSNGANGARGFDFRRPATADSAKTSNLDSDDNLEDDQSN